MTESITREVAEERLDPKSLPGISYEAIEMIMDAMFPPKFIPKKGEVIEVWTVVSPWPVFRKFIKMYGDEYICKAENPKDLDRTWTNARPQTPQEKGE